MSLIADLKSLDKRQQSAIWASYLGWTLDAFDFFLLVFMLKTIAAEFGTDVKSVSYAIFLTLAARPFGALWRGLVNVGGTIAWVVRGVMSAVRRVSSEHQRAA